jgi:lysyl-tRNA synthetase class II
LKLLKFELTEKDRERYESRVRRIKKAGYFFQIEDLETLTEVDTEHLTIWGRVLRLRKLKTKLLVDFLSNGLIRVLIVTGSRRKIFEKLIRIYDYLCIIGVEKDNEDIIVKSFTVVSPCAISVNTNEIKYLHQRLISNCSDMRILKQYSDWFYKISKLMRKNGFMEVRTPTLLKTFYAGNARPFVTYSNNFHKNLYLKFSSEPLLKEILAGGADKVYEFSSVFRNEADSKNKNYEFKVLEFCTSNESLAQTRTYLEEIVYLFLGIKNIPEIDFRALCDGKRIRNKFKYFKKTIVPSLQEPVFVTHIPSGQSPFIAECKEDQLYSERQFLVINGMTISEIYQNERDPFKQLDFLKKQFLKERDYKIDYSSYIHSQLVGSPIINMCFISINRLIMVATGQEDCRSMI